MGYAVRRVRSVCKIGIEGEQFDGPARQVAGKTSVEGETRGVMPPADGVDLPIRDADTAIRQTTMDAPGTPRHMPAHSVGCPREVGPASDHTICVTCSA